MMEGWLSRASNEIFCGGSNSSASFFKAVSRKSRSSGEIHLASRGWSRMQNHQTGSQMNGSIPSRMSIVCQPYAPSSQPVSGAEPATASGWQRSQ